jgi:hypothetical protein
VHVEVEFEGAGSDVSGDVMRRSDAIKCAEAAAVHVGSYLLPEVARQNGKPASRVGYLVASAVMSPKVDVATQVQHPRRPIAVWDVELVDGWSCESTVGVSSVIEQFQNGREIELLAAEWGTSFSARAAGGRSRSGKFGSTFGGVAGAA